MDENAIAEYISTTFPDVAATTAMGYRFFFVGADRMMPFATIGTQDNEGDRASNLDRPGVYRLNVGVGRETYTALFGPPPRAADATAAPFDFTAFDRIMPHPVYASYAWVCVL